MEKFNINDVHFFQKDETRIAYDIVSGAVHLIDELTFDVLTALKSKDGLWEESLEELSSKYRQEDLAEVKEELVELRAQGAFFTPDTLEYKDNQNFMIKSLCLHIAHDCNLRCRYCFASTGDFGGQRLFMDTETGKKAIDYLLANSGHRPICEVDFFGGEPLMNFGVVKELVAYGKEEAKKYGKKIEFTLTTNGTLLDEEVIEFLNQEKMQVILSIDGRKEVNDYMRPGANKRGSYDTIVPKYKNFIASREKGSASIRTEAEEPNYYVRGTYTRHNIDFSEDVFHLHDLGFDRLSVEPVVADASCDYAFQEEDLEEINKQYDKLAEGYLERNEKGQTLNFFHFNVNLDHGPCLPRRLSGCGAGYEYFAVTPEGDLYPCHQFVGQEEFLIGNVHDGLKNEELSKNFKNAHIYNKEKCQNCWARFLCSGGCHANAWGFNKDIYKPYDFGCTVQKKRLETAIYVQTMSKLQK